MTAHLNKVDVNMKRCVAQKKQKMRLCRNFVRHEIDNSDLQGTNVLMSGSVIGNNEYILLFQRLERRKVIWYFNWQSISHLLIIL